MIRALLFDFGGTLDSDGIHWSEKFFDLYRRLDVPVSKPDYEKAYVAAEKRMAERAIAPNDPLRATLRQQVFFQFEYLANAGLIKSQAVALTLAAEIAEEAYRDVLASIATVRPMLQDLRQNYKMAIVSNFTGNLATVVRELGLDELFDLFVDSTEVGISKPDPRIFALALEKMGIVASDAIVIGDSYDRDIEPAATLGIKTVFLHGRSWKEPISTERADIVIHSIMELPDALTKLTFRW